MEHPVTKKAVTVNADGSITFNPKAGPIPDVTLVIEGDLTQQHIKGTLTRVITTDPVTGEIDEVYSSSRPRHSTSDE
jgi:hypothetical protein